MQQVHNNEFSLETLFKGYLGLPTALLAALVTFAITYGALASFIGTGGLALALAAALGFVPAFIYFLEEGFSIINGIGEVGDELDKLDWRKALKNNLDFILQITFIGAFTLGTILLVLFPPAGIASLVAQGIALLHLGGLSLPALGIVVGSAAAALASTLNAAGQFIFSAMSHVIRTGQWWPEKNGKSNWHWENILPQYLGLPMAIYGSIAFCALGYGSVAVLMGAGPLAPVLTSVIAVIFGLGYFAKDCLSARRKLAKWGKALDNIKPEQRQQIKQTVFTAAVILSFAAAATVLIMFPPAGLAAPISTALAALHLAELSTPALSVLLISSFTFAMYAGKSIYKAFTMKKQAAQPAAQAQPIKASTATIQTNLEQKWQKAHSKPPELASHRRKAAQTHLKKPEQAFAKLNQEMLANLLLNCKAQQHRRPVVTPTCTVAAAARAC